mgnify:CR=1 FL=1
MKVIKESLKEAATPAENIKLRHKVYNAVNAAIDAAFDNFAIALASDLHDYDPNWCAEGQSKEEAKKNQLQDSFAIAITDMLLANMDK